MSPTEITIRVTVAFMTERQLVARLATVIDQHRAACGPEGFVPQALAEDLVRTLRARQELITDEDVREA